MAHSWGPLVSFNLTSIITPYSAREYKHEESTGLEIAEFQLRRTRKGVERLSEDTKRHLARIFSWEHEPHQVPRSCSLCNDATKTFNSSVRYDANLSRTYKMPLEAMRTSPYSRLFDLFYIVSIQIGWITSGYQVGISGREDQSLYSRTWRSTRVSPRKQSRIRNALRPG